MPYPDENSTKSVFKKAMEEEQREVKLHDNERLKRNH